MRRPPRRLVLGLCYLPAVWLVIDFTRCHRGYAPFNPAPRKGV